MLICLLWLWLEILAFIYIFSVASSLLNQPSDLLSVLGSFLLLIDCAFIGWSTKKLYEYFKKNVVGEYDE